jgi:thioredoxin-dependent peroxiredoxin
MLQNGSPAPDFSLKDQDNNEVSLTSLKGKWVVLYFYPKDMTPGCTIEACSFQEILPNFSSINAEIIGISKDSVKSHKKFADKYRLTFTLLSDVDGRMCEAYGVWQKKSKFGKSYMGIVRSTFIIDPQGNIATIYPKVNVKEHHLEVQQALKSLQK